MKIEKFLVPFLVLIFLSGSFSAISQVYTYKKASKVHYEIITTQNDSIQERINQAAFDFTEFDALRFLNTRRMIPVSGYNSTVVLYSAQELQEKFDIIEKQRRTFYMIKSDLSTLENRKVEKNVGIIAARIRKNET